MLPILSFASTFKYCSETQDQANDRRHPISSLEMVTKHAKPPSICVTTKRKEVPLDVQALLDKAGGQCVLEKITWACFIKIFTARQDSMVHCTFGLHARH